MAALLKKYRLIRGTHWIPNPEYDPTNPQKQAEMSHIQAQPGAEISLTDDQFKLYSDKFAPIESAASEVRDQDAAQLDAARAHAAATGQDVNPNVPLPAKPSPTSPGAPAFKG